MEVTEKNSWKSWCPSKAVSQKPADCGGRDFVKRVNNESTVIEWRIVIRGQGSECNEVKMPYFLHRIMFDQLVPLLLLFFVIPLWHALLPYEWHTQRQHVTYTIICSTWHYLQLLYLISKCMHIIGRSRVTQHTLNCNSALSRHYCLHEYSCMSIVPSFIIRVSLSFLYNNWNHSTDKYKSQLFVSYVYHSSKYGIILMK